MMKKTAAQEAYFEYLQKEAALQRKDIEELAEDLNTQMGVYGPEAAVGAVPKSLQQKIREIESGSDKQTLTGLAGGAGGGILGAGVGALTTGLAKGRVLAPFGALSGIPGALVGYHFAKKLQREKELQELLKERFLS